jgi:hypothetical protein
MKRWIRHSLAVSTTLVLGGGAAVYAQTQSTPAQPPEPSSAQQPATSGQAAQPQRSLQMVQTKAELNTSLDAKKAKQGEAVKAKLEEDVQIPNSQALPKNTVLEGHVDQVTPSENKSDSTMVVTFDKARMKSGQEVPIKATVIAMAEPALMAQDGTGGGAPSADSMPSGGGAPMASGGGGGARGGGGGGSSSASSGSSAPSAQAAPMAASDQGGGSQGSGAPGVPGVKLTSNVHEHSSATFTSQGQNVRIPDGTQMELAITVIPAGVTLQ